MKISSVIYIALIVVITASCDSSKNGESSQVTDDVKPVLWDWTSYPESSELKLRVLPVDMQPKQSFEIQSEGSGVITLKVREKVSSVDADAIIAEMAVASLSEQEERINIQEQKQRLENMRAKNLDIPEQRNNANNALKEARREVKLLSMILENPAMKEMSRELFGSGIGEVSSSSLKEAKDALALAERKVAWAEEFQQKIRDGQLRIQDMDLTRNKRNLKAAKDRAIYKAPFSGELRLEVNFIEGQSEYTVASRETIATLSNYEEIHAHLTIVNAEWINLEPEQLYIQLGDRNKTVMYFLEDKVEKDKRTRREVRKYIYSIPLENNEGLKRLAGAQVNADLIYKLPEICYIVPKYDLSLYALGKTNTLNWNEMVEQLWPGAKLLAEGRKDLAIQYPLSK